MNPAPAPSSPARAVSVLGRVGRFLAVAVAALITVALTALPAAAQGSASTTLRVEGMTCSGCEATVRSVLTGLGGVSDAQADNTTQTARVTYDPVRISPPQMVQAINTNTYYQASVSDGAPSAEPTSSGAGIATWIGVAALAAAAVAVGVLFVRRRAQRTPAG